MLEYKIMATLNIRNVSEDTRRKIRIDAMSRRVTLGGWLELALEAMDRGLGGRAEAGGQGNEEMEPYVSRFQKGVYGARKGKCKKARFVAGEGTRRE
jgi:hypothetical protein